MHIGHHIREKIIPSDISVKDAAAKLGVGRPALSNLLNGKASLSPKMAARLERAFGADAESLLRLQADIEAKALSGEKKTLAVARQVPHIGTIRAAEISNWAEKIDSRALLPALLRKLIAPMGGSISDLVFPSYDESQKPGWDGWLVSDAASPWVPHGASGWEFGCNQNSQSKANRDFRKRTKNTDEVIRQETTYVFVTPHKWEGKAEWVLERKQESSWKDVVALDAHDLEAWLEHSLQAQTFLLECLGRKPNDFSSLESVWPEWAGVCDPVFPHELFKKASDGLVSKLSLWLKGEPQSPFVIQASTKFEALACITSMFINSEDLQQYSGRIVHLTGQAGNETLKRTTVPMLVVVDAPEIELKLGDLPRHHHTIIVRNRTLLHDDPDFSVDLLNSIDFDNALRTIDIHPAEIDRLSKVSGGSLTVLRREWATIPEVKNPLWTRQEQSLNAVTSVALVGAWNSKSEADKFILSYFANKDSYASVEHSIAHLEAMDDSPLWRIAEFRGVLSKFDALAVTAKLITDDVMDRFFDVAHAVLSEDDPKLDLPEDKRWAASIYNKTRQHSAVLRRSVRETLAILDMQADAWFSHLELSPSQRVSDLITALLTPFTTRLIEAQDDDLPHYAEAAPDTFLRIVEADLKLLEPAIYGVLKPTSSGPFSSPSRTGMLWALETIAWNPLYYERVVKILARMSEVQIDDNWGNKPINSLSSLFRSWMPQTAAPIEYRKRAISNLFNSHPKIAWDMAIQQLERGSRSGSYNSRPNWRTDSHGAGEPVTIGEDNEMALHVLEIILHLEEYDWEMLAEIAENCHMWPEADQSRAWKIIQHWAENAAECDKARLKERLRKHLHISSLRKNRETRETGENAWKAMEYLTPISLVERHRWLFSGQWLPESMDEIQDERIDWRERDSRTKEARKLAAFELYQHGGIDALIEATEDSDSPHVITESLALSLADETIFRLIPEIFEKNSTQRGVSYVAGLVFKFRSETEINTLVERVFDSLDGEDQVSFLKCLPVGSSTWRLPAFANTAIFKEYWKSVRIHWCNLDEEELNEALENLLKAKRPAMAVHAASHQWEKIRTPLIERILNELAHNHEQIDGDSPPQGHEISDALKEISQRKDIDEDRLVALEFAYMKALRFSSYSFPTIKKSIATNPNFFVEALIWAFKRRDNKADEERYTSPTDQSRSSLAERCYDLLDQANVIPGISKETLDEQKNALGHWVSEVRRMSSEVARGEICDSKIGTLLSKCPVGSDGVWPHQAVRHVIEEIDTEELRSGLSIGVRNNRGVRTSMPYEGGNQERALVEKYLGWADAVKYEFPATARILNDIAESYSREAKRNDEDAKLRTRLQRR